MQVYFEQNGINDFNFLLIIIKQRHEKESYH